MQKTFSKVLALIIAVIMIMSVIPTAVFADNTMHINIAKETALAGSTVSVDISIENNPGLASLKLVVDFDKVLTLTGVTYNTEMGGQSINPETTASPVTLNWVSPFAEYKGDGVFATLTFAVSEAIEGDYVAGIVATYNPDDIYGGNEINIPVTLNNGSVDVVSVVPGDINGDLSVNNKDITRFFQYLADWKVEVNKAALDTNGDGKVNNKDLTRLFQFLANYKVELYPKINLPDTGHTLMEYPAKDATCTTAGNIRYWYCTDCGKYFSNSLATKEITLDETVIPATGHSYSEEWSSDGTYHWHAATCEHSTFVDKRAEHIYNSDNVCIVCGAEKGVDPTKPYKIKYRLTEYNVNKGDAYIGSQSIDNSVNRVSFNSADSFNLEPISCNGYEFEGWYTEAGERVTKISAGTVTDITLYAHWKAITYDVTYKLYQTPLGQITEEKYLHYTINKGLIDLPNPTIYNYIFIGWYTDDGEEVSEIPVGTYGDITLNAYWTSKRNLAKKVDKLGDPIILEDTDSGVIYYTYEIGTIENVPLSDAIWTIQSVFGLEQQKSETVTTSVTQTKADSISDTISNSTVDSGTWTLSEGWNDSTSVTEEWAEEHGMTVEEANELCKSSSNTFAVTSSNGGSNSKTTTDGTTTVDYNSQTYDHGNSAEFGAKISANYSNTTEVSAGVKAGYGPVSAEAGVKNTSKFEIGGELSAGYKQQQNTSEHTGTDTTKVNTTVDASTSTWNNSSSASSTQTASQKQSVSKAISEVISSKKGYGSTYSENGEHSETRGTSNTESSSVNSSSTLTWSSVETVTTTSTYKTDGKSDGCYRLVIAGTAHIFGVVGYDIATKSFFTYTFSVMDDKQYEFLDYAPDLNFNDCENGVIPFEIPYFVQEYSTMLTAKTEGLHFKTDSANGTAKVTGYDGAFADVTIPAYITSGGRAYRVTEITNTAFAGKDIRAIALNRFIDVIPDGAFKNCTKLEQISGGFTRIGAEAFSGCTSLENFNISSYMTEIGENAFLGVDKITACVLEKEAALQAAMQSINYKLPNDISNDEMLAYVKAISKYANEYGLPDCSNEEEIIAYASDFVTYVTNEKIFGNAACEEITKYANDIIAYSIDLIAYAKELTENVVSQIVSSGAKQIVLGIGYIIEDCELDIDVPQITLFELNGNGETFKNLKLKSAAATTFISNITISDCTRIPLEISSGSITFDAVSVWSPSYCMLLSAPTVNIVLKRDNKFVSQNGRAIVCRNLDISSVYEDSTDGYIDVSGNVYICGNIVGDGYLTVDNGEIIQISEEEFSKYIKGSSTVTFNANEGTVEETSRTVYCGSEYGELPVPTRDYYSFAGWFTSADGGEQVTADMLAGTDDITLYAHWNANSYTAVWSKGTNCSITVKRTSSPNAGAATGTINSGDIVYYGDVLSVTYAANTGYSISENGSKSITVTGNVTASDIYAKATADDCKYNIVYKSSNGTDLGSSSVTYKFGTTNTISAPAKTGYTTPSNQSVKWDEISKTITFIYSPKSVSTPQTIGSGWWWKGSSGYGITYSTSVEYRNRTANSIQVKVNWTNSISNAFYGFGQYFSATVGGVSTGTVTIATASKWPQGNYYNSSASASSGWITVPVSATQTSVSITCNGWAQSDAAACGTWSTTFAIPTY